MSQEQGTAAQHSAPGGAAVWGGKWPDSWIELLMPWPTSRWSAKERSSTACSPVPSKSISRAKLVVEHTPVMFLLLWTAFLPRAVAMPVAATRQAMSVSVLETPAGGWAWQALISDWKNVSNITMKGEEQNQVSGALYIYRSVSKHSGEFQNTKQTDIYRSPQANETLWVKLYWYIWKINLVTALQLCLIKATAVRWCVLLHTFPVWVMDLHFEPSILLKNHQTPNGAEPCFCWK